MHFSIAGRMRSLCIIRYPHVRYWCVIKIYFTVWLTFSGSYFISAFPLAHSPSILSQSLSDFIKWCVVILRSHRAGTFGWCACVCFMIILLASIVCRLHSQYFAYLFRRSTRFSLTDQCTCLSKCLAAMDHILFINRKVVAIIGQLHFIPMSTLSHTRTHTSNGRKVVHDRLQSEKWWCASHTQTWAHRLHRPHDDLAAHKFILDYAPDTHQHDSFVLVDRTSNRQTRDDNNGSRMAAYRIAIASAWAPHTRHSSKWSNRDLRSNFCRKFV